MKEGWLKKGLDDASREYDVYIKIKKKDFKMLWGKTVDHREDYVKEEWKIFRKLLAEHGVIL